MKSRLHSTGKKAAWATIGIKLCHLHLGVLSVITARWVKRKALRERKPIMKP